MTHAAEQGRPDVKEQRRVWRAAQEYLPPGRLVFIPCLRRVGVGPLTATLMGLLTLGTGCLLSDCAALTVAGIVLFGLASGALTLARSELLVLGYPAALYGSVNGWLARPVNLAQALTPVLMGGLYLWTDGYWASLAMLGGAGALAAWFVSGVHGQTVARQS